MTYYVKKIIKVVPHDPSLIYAVGTEIEVEGLWFRCIRDTTPGISHVNTYYWQTVSELGPTGTSGTRGPQGLRGPQGPQGAPTESKELFIDVMLNPTEGTIEYNDTLARLPTSLPKATVDPLNGEIKY